MRRMLLTLLGGLLVATSAHARPRLIHRRTCVSPAPAPVQYQTIPALRVPVPAIPPQVVMPQVASLGTAGRGTAVQLTGGTACSGGVCPIR